MPNAALNPVEVDALRAGYRRVRSVMSLLDAINVFPVADADTGANLAASLIPLDHDFASSTELKDALLFSAQGNSGNITAAFLCGVLDAPTRPLRERLATGEARARAAVAEPQPGTMLTVLERLVEVTHEGTNPTHDDIVAALAAAVESTTSQLPVLADHRVVDAGALGLFLFLETYLGVLAESPRCTNVWRRFDGRLTLEGKPTGAPAEGNCVDALIRVRLPCSETLDELRKLGDSTVLVHADDVLKLHVHASDPEGLRRRLARHGEILRFETSALTPHSPDTHHHLEPGPVEGTRPSSPSTGTPDPLTPESGTQSPGIAGRGAEAHQAQARTPRGQQEWVEPTTSTPFRVATDAAGSLSKEQAARLGIELLASRVTLPTGAALETEVNRAAVWQALRDGHRVTTAQAPLAHRHQAFDRLLRQYDRVAYLCVGSAYTGNHAAALDWARERGVTERFVVIDSGTASGKLAVVARRLAELARSDPQLDPTRQAELLVGSADELLFIDRLEFLRQSGRLSAPAAWFGNLLGFKPAVTPTARGARRVAICRDRNDQLALARKRLTELTQGRRCFVLLQHTDNEDWVDAVARPALVDVAPHATFEVAPLSLTTAVHTGPGTWSVAFLPTEAEESPCA